MIAQTIGHEKIRERLFSSPPLSGAFLFSGPFGIGKSLLAKELAGHILGSKERCLAENHPDLRIVRPLGKSALHPIEQIRELSSEVAKGPLEASSKVVVIEEAHRMGAPSANALLKTLEEPTSNTLLILITHKKERLLPTIVSRCRPCYFAPLQDLSPLARGSFGNAKRLEQGGDIRRTELLSLLDALDDYSTLTASIQHLSAELEEGKKKNLKTFRLSLALEDLPAAARVAKELEIEGRAQVAYLEEWEYLLGEFALQSKDAKGATVAYEGIEQFTKPATCLENLCFHFRAHSAY